MQHYSTAAVSRVLLAHGIQRGDMTVRTPARGGIPGRTAVCLISDQAVTLAARQRTEIEQALDKAGYLVIRWAHGLFWTETKTAAEQRRQAREATRQYRNSKGAGN